MGRQVITRADTGGTRQRSKNPIRLAAVDLAVILIIKWGWPAAIPFSVFHFWQPHGSVIQAFARIWPVFAIGAGLNLAYFAWAGLSGFALVRQLARKASFRGAAIGAVVPVVIVPVLEETIFRWLTFYVAIVTLTGLNYLVFGFAGLGLPSWIFVHAARPVANFFTLGDAHAILYNKTSWAVGAAVLVANGKFRSGHLYQGFLGWVWSWYMGIFLFVVMFQYGLFAAIIVHAAYNFMAGAAAMVFLGAVRRIPPARQAAHAGLPEAGQQQDPPVGARE
jgi:hypothetical protein